MTSLKYFIILFFSISLIYSQDTNIIKYFPLNFGNVWVYYGYYTTTQCQSSYYQKIFIDSSRIINNKKYFKFNYLHRFISGNGNCGYTQFYDGYYRVDSVNGNIYRYRIDTNCIYSTFESLVDSLYSKPIDTARICSGTQLFPKVARDTNTQNIFSLNKPTKYFEGGNFFEYAFFTRYAKDLGVTEMRQGGIAISSHSYLKGCIINGIIYGDTNFYYVGIQPVSNEVPTLFKLNQNYPNPFNPETEIGFHIPKSSFVNIIIYDALGNEIETLLNENLAPGIYNVKWNASNYPSGVYFYKLTAGDVSTSLSTDFTETKKMVLIK